MGWFGNIFRKKEGGSFVGNLVRNLAKEVPIVGGIYNSAFPKPDAAGASGFGNWLDGLFKT